MAFMERMACQAFLKVRSSLAKSILTQGPIGNSLNCRWVLISKRRYFRPANEGQSKTVAQSARSAMNQILPGDPYPLGATKDEEGVNFAIFSEHAEKVELRSEERRV